MVVRPQPKELTIQDAKKIQFLEQKSTERNKRKRKKSIQWLFFGLGRRINAGDRAALRLLEWKQTAAGLLVGDWKEEEARGVMGRSDAEEWSRHSPPPGLVRRRRGKRIWGAC